jgi:predicted small secreted protein
MPESESAVLIEKLQRARRRWKAIAIGLSVVLAILVTHTVMQAKLARERAVAGQHRAASAQLKAL